MIPSTWTPPSLWDRLSARLLIRRPTIIFRGLRRSGNHALIAWLHGMTDLHFHNDFVSAMNGLPEDGQDHRCPNYLGVLQRHFLEPHPRWFLRWRHRQHTRQILISLEDLPYDYRPFRHLARADYRDVLVIRSASNMFASRIKGALRSKESEGFNYPRTNGKIMQHWVSLWKGYARCLLSPPAQLNRPVVIYYDSWFSDINYRKALAEALSLSFNDSALERMPYKYARSSFDAEVYDGSAQKMDVLNRAAYLPEEGRTILNEVLADEEISELQEQIDKRFALSSSN